MKILLAPNSMKGSLNAFEFADIVEEAFLKCSSNYKIKKVPVADGGDHTGEVLGRSLNAKEVAVRVRGPFGKIVNSKYFKKDEVAIIEMADASGIKLVDVKKLNPLKATSYGTGELLFDAVSKGCTKIFFAIGGSATVDGGMGMMEALGFRFFDEEGNLLEGNGGNLSKVIKIEEKEFSNNISIKIICDVDNPLLGEKGAARIFGPQKGATAEMVPLLENGLKNWAEILRSKCGEDFSTVAGAGAAGGISIPLLAFLNAELVPGADFILSQLHFDKWVKWADVVITGEGKIDSQTLNNKAPFAVAKKAREFEKSVFAFGGKAESEASVAFDGIYSFLNGPMMLEDAVKNSGELLYQFSYEFAKTILTLK